jgi:hypothetical protein
MKYLIIPLLLILLFSCKEEPKVLEATNEEEARIREIGQKASAQLLNSLQKKLKTTITNQGMLSAINVCNFDAINLTDSITETMEDVLYIKRTSLRYRNPHNAPDRFEREALIYFLSTYQNTGNLPDDLIQVITDRQEISNRYYKPLVMKSLCLNCHGPSSAIAEDVKYQLRRYYPGDQAHGYNIDDFRGLVRVSMK